MGRWGRRVAAPLLAPLLAAGGSACAGPRPDIGACEGVPDQLVEELSASLSVDGTLRHARSAPGEAAQYFVSAELLPSGEEEDFPGDILTWVTPSLDAPSFAAVDVNAREASTLPPSDLDVRAEGAVTSRGCVLPVRGEPATSDCEAGFEELCDE
jgi:hypothetical protein